VPPTAPRAIVPYPGGRQPNSWNPNPSEPTHRFVLANMAPGQVGSELLAVMGMNPSHANEFVSDATVNNLIAASDQLGRPGWAMLNLYPERASSPADLRAFDQNLLDANCDAISQFIQVNRISEVWGAWGDIPNATIRRAKAAVRKTLARLGTPVFYFGDLTAKGEPRHLNPRSHKLDVTAQKSYLPW
jgi:hypothetical protein